MQKEQEAVLGGDVDLASGTLGVPRDQQVDPSVGNFKRSMHRPTEEILKHTEGSMFLQCHFILLVCLFPLPPFPKVVEVPPWNSCITGEKQAIQLQPTCSQVVCHFFHLSLPLPERQLLLLPKAQSVPLLPWRGRLPQWVPPCPLPPSSPLSHSDGVPGSPVRLTGPPQILCLP